MKTIILNFRKQCPRWLTALASLGLFIASAQTVNWTSSHPDIVSVDANGTIKMISEPLGTTNVTITAISTQNEKAITSTKVIELNHYYPGCNTPSVLIDGIWWAACNVGASTPTAFGTRYTWIDRSQCASPWRVPTVHEMIRLDNLSGGTKSTIGDNVNSNGGLWAQRDGVDGRWFSGTGSKTASGVFLPAGGYYYPNNGRIENNVGAYWIDYAYSGTTDVGKLYFTGTASYPSDGGESGTCMGYVRCVMSY